MLPFYTLELSTLRGVAAFPVLILLISAGAILIFYAARRDKRLDKISGPRGNPITGIGLELPPDALQKFQTWAAEYGEVFKVRVGWWNWVVLNSPEAVKEVMDKQVHPPSLLVRCHRHYLLLILDCFVACSQLSHHPSFRHPCLSSWWAEGACPACHMGTSGDSTGPWSTRS